MTDSTAIDDMASWISAYRQASAEETKWRNMKDTIRGKIADRLHDAGATSGTVNGKPAVTIKTVKGRFNQKRFGADHPDMIEQYRDPDGTRFELAPEE